MPESKDRSLSLKNAGQPLLDALVSAAVDGIVVIDDQGRILLFNTGAEALFGYTEADVLGSNVNVLMPEPYHSAHDGYMHSYNRTGRKRIIGIGREVSGIKSNGEEFPLDLSVGEAQFDGRRLFIGILRDLSQRSHLEAMLRSERKQVQQLERSLAHVHRASTLGEMAAGIAHEINQPLAAISTYADAGIRLINNESTDIDRIGYALDQIGQQARRAGEVVRRMRGLARQEEVSREPNDINNLILDLLELAKLEARDLDAPINLELEESLPQVLVDAVQIQQVLLNLIRNALEAMVKRSQASRGVLIRTRMDEKGLIETTVADHGMGIDESRVDSIFNPFESSKPTGMGIGLSICKTIISSHGGKLWYEPNEGGGSQFKFTVETVN